MIKILDLLNENNIVVLDSESYSEVIDTLLELVKPSEKVGDYQSFCKAITDREKIVSTGIGLGLAVPHARHDSVHDFVAAAVLVKNGVEWRSIDDSPVHFAIMIGSPEDSHKQYLNLLSQIVLFWKKSSEREKILAANTPNDILEIMRSYFADKS
ncbi:MAG: PTS sugar transporter subunit IIA [Spirochaetales bacterium]|nr:PTS sugar transporter subunit IIA [Spirochaetales bacterium]MBR6060837.1 PTS sugar transporter subunit IIA [Spirochaetales bacterium]MBR6201359.1 PTS sugar transporter subunit IIA [Spirochaetales bacterium]